jgi:1,4-dihydroxy-2-naphthoate octaprenyltransferase
VLWPVALFSFQAENLISETCFSGGRLSPHKRLQICFKAARAQFFSVSLIPVMLAAALAKKDGFSFHWPAFFTFSLAVILMHSGSNLINDYYDFRRGVDKPGAYGSGCVLAQGLLSPRRARVCSYLCFLAAFIPGVFLVALRGPVLLFFGFAGFLGGYGYTGKPFGFKYLALGEVLVFLLLGPLLVVSGYFAFSGRLSLSAAYVSLPAGLLAAAILHSNNLRDMRLDREAGITTMALWLGLRGAKTEYYLLLVSSFLCIPVMCSLGVVPPAAFFTWLTLPAAVSCALSVRNAGVAQPSGIANIDVRTAGLHLAFGLIYTVSFLAPVLLRRL